MRDRAARVAARPPAAVARPLRSPPHAPAAPAPAPKSAAAKPGAAKPAGKEGEGGGLKAAPRAPRLVEGEVVGTEGRNPGRGRGDGAARGAGRGPSGGRGAGRGGRGEAESADPGAAPKRAPKDFDRHSNHARGCVRDRHTIGGGPGWRMPRHPAAPSQPPPITAHALTRRHLWRSPQPRDGEEGRRREGQLGQGG